MRLMMRWSPMRSVFSIEPEGMTRAWPIVPLIRRKASPTQNQAITSRFTRWAMGSLGSAMALLAALTVSLPATLPISLSLGFSVASAFTFHRHRSFEKCVVRRVSVLGIWSGSVAFANFELYEIRGIDARVTRRTELAFGVIHGLAQRGE